MHETCLLKNVGRRWSANAARRWPKRSFCAANSGFSATAWISWRCEAKLKPIARYFDGCEIGARSVSP
jgi:hypothetical protein